MIVRKTLPAMQDISGNDIRTQGIVGSPYRQIEVSYNTMDGGEGGSGGNIGTMRPFGAMRITLGGRGGWMRLRSDHKGFSRLHISARNRRSRPKLSRFDQTEISDGVLSFTQLFFS